MYDRHSRDSKGQDSDAIHPFRDVAERFAWSMDQRTVALSAADRGILSAFLIVIGSAAVARISMAYAAVTIDLHGSVRGAYRTATCLRSAAYWLWILGSPPLLAGCGWGTAAIDLASQF